MQAPSANLQKSGKAYSFSALKERFALLLEQLTAARTGKAARPTTRPNGKDKAKSKTKAKDAD